MKIFSHITVLSVSLTLVIGCAQMPLGPNVLALPGSGKNFDEFRRDDVECRQFAQEKINNVNTNQAAADSGARSAILGTLIGALAGAAINGKKGAAVGAGSGLLVGSLAGTDAGQSAAHGTQRQYDNASTQCMYAKGQQVPLPAGAVAQTRSLGQSSTQLSSGIPSPAPRPPDAAIPPPPPSAF